MSWVPRGVVAASVLLVVGVLSACGPRQPWRSELVSVNAAGTSSGNRLSDGGVLSPDGTKVAFRSLADDLGPTDRNGEYDIYLRDLESGTTTLVSANAAGTDGGNDDSQDATFSPDGTKVAFHSLADDLGPTDTNGDVRDVYVRDLASGTTTLVSVDATGADSGDAESTGPVFSPDGTKIAFYSRADDLVPGDTNGAWDVFVRDLVTGTTSLVSLNAAGESGGGSWPLFSPDGTRIAFASGGELVPTDSNDRDDVYVRDLLAGTTSLVSTNAAGTNGGNGRSYLPSFSPDGTRIAFTSSADDLGPTDTNEAEDIYVRDLASGTTSLVSVNAEGTDAGNARSEVPLFSPAGLEIAFTSRADDLVPTDSNGASDVFLHDLETGSTSLVTANVAGTDSARGAAAPEIAFSPDGSRIAFWGSDQERAELTEAWPTHVFVRDLVHETTTLVSATADGTAGGDRDSRPRRSVALTSMTGVFSSDGRRVVFDSVATNLGPADGERLDPSDADDWDVYVATLRGADLSVVGEAQPGPGEPGEAVTYRFEVANGGPDPAEDAAVAVLLPDGVTVLDVEASLGECADTADTGEEAPRLVVCHLGDVPEGAGGELAVIASVEAPASAPLAAIGAVSSDPTVDPVHSNNVVVATPGPPVAAGVARGDT